MHGLTVVTLRSVQAFWRLRWACRPLIAGPRRFCRPTGVKQWITTDWNTYFTAIADDPLARKALDVAGLNFYQPSADNPKFFEELAWHLDMHRSAHGLGHFMVTETRVGVAGSVTQFDPFPTKHQFLMWMLQPAAYGAFGLMYWSGNRWVGGHWPHWGGILDWTGEPEPDFPWLIELGSFFAKNSRRLLDHPVKATAAVITDFNQRAALQEYPHTPASKGVVAEAFDALHRIGMGADSINLDEASKPGALSKYRLVMIPAATALDSPPFPPALRAYVEGGGHVIVSPFTAYMSWDGVFRSDGFGANLKEITGVLVRTARRMGTAADQRPDQQAAWAGAGMEGVSKVGADGYVEFMDVAPGVEVIAKFQSNEPVLSGRPAATFRKVGKGGVVQLAFWPADDSVARLARQLVPDTDALLASPTPHGVQAVPRADKSLFVINTSRKPAIVSLSRTATDRISGRTVRGNARLESYEVFWLE
jgi:beta-galactosidase